MLKVRTLVIRWSYLLADLFLISFLIQLFVIQDGSASISYGLWLMEITAILLLNTVLKQRAVTISFAMLCNIIGAVLTGISSFFLFSQTEPTVLRQIIIAILAALPAVHAAILTAEEPEQHQTVLYLDASIAATALVLFLEYKETLLQTDALSLLGKLACLGLLLSLMISRMERRPETSRSGHPLTGTLILGGLLLLAFLLAAFSAAHFQGISHGIIGAVVWFSQQVFQVIRFCGRKLGSFFLWLLSLFPAKEETWIPPEPESSATVMEEAAVESYDTLGIILLCLLGVCIVIGILYFLYRLRGKRWQEKQERPAVSRTGIRRSGFRNHLRELLQRLKRQLRFQYHYLCCRKTPAGLLVWTERKLRSTSLCRIESESPPAFLRRLSGQVSLPDPAVPMTNKTVSPPDFLTLADLLERQFYRHTEEKLPQNFYRQYKKSFAKAKPSYPRLQYKRRKKTILNH